MTRATKVLLLLALATVLAGLVIDSGIVDVSAVPELYVVLPVGAVFAGMFLISYILQGESAKYEREHHGAQTAGDRFEPVAAANQERS